MGGAQLTGRLSRRELLASLLGAPLAAQIAACERSAPAPSQAREVQGALLGQSHAHGHRLRSPPREDDFAGAPEQTFEAVIVGGGPAGLSAGHRLLQRGVMRFSLLELEPSVGGTSAGGRSELTPYPWGAHYITRPGAHNAALIALLREMGVATGVDARGRPDVAEQYLVRQAKERVFYRGFWYPQLVPTVDASATDRKELSRFAALMASWARRRDGRGRPAFAIPVDHGSDDAEVAALDRITARQWLHDQGLHGERLHWYADYACRDDYGLGLDHVSAWALVFYHASRIDPDDGEHAPVITWPEGNAGLTQHLRGKIGDRVRTGQLVVDIRPDRSAGGGARVHVIDTRSGAPRVLRARRVICATPQFISRRIVSALRAADDDTRASFQYGAWMVANLHLQGRPQSHGIPEAWDSVLYDSPSLGYVSATHQRGRSFGPTVWTYYMPMADARAADGRQRLWQADWAGLRDTVTADLRRAHPDLDAHLQRVDVWRWGHGMVQPRPGLRLGGVLEGARRPAGAVHFAHSDLSGVALFEEAFHHGRRAADEVADALQQGWPG